MEKINNTSNKKSPKKYMAGSIGERHLCSCMYGGKKNFYVLAPPPKN